MGAPGSTGIAGAPGCTTSLAANPTVDPAAAIAAQINNIFIETSGIFLSNGGTIEVPRVETLRIPPLRQTLIAIGLLALLLQ